MWLIAQIACVFGLLQFVSNAGIYESCTSDEDCDSSALLRCKKQAAGCGEGRCECGAGYIYLWGQGTKCLKIRGLHEPCSEGDDWCNMFTGAISHLTCTGGQCSCPVDYYLSRHGDACIPSNVPDNWLKDKCNDNRECVDHGLQCAEGLCECRDGYRPEGRICYQAQLGEQCSNLNQCATQENIDLTSGTSQKNHYICDTDRTHICVCPPGLVQRKVMYHDGLVTDVCVHQDAHTMAALGEPCSQFVSMLHYDAVLLCSQGLSCLRCEGEDDYTCQIIHPGNVSPTPMDPGSDSGGSSEDSDEDSDEITLGGEGDECGTDNNCDVTLGLHCVKQGQGCELGACRCPPGYMFPRGIAERCLKIQGLHDPCNTTHHWCHQQGHLNTPLDCREGECVCPQGYYLSEHVDACVENQKPDVWRGDRCTIGDGSCLLNGLECREGVCDCMNGYQPKGRICVRAQLGSPCLTLENCADDGIRNGFPGIPGEPGAHLICDVNKTRTCICPPGLVQRQMTMTEGSQVPICVHALDHTIAGPGESCDGSWSGLQHEQLTICPEGLSCARCQGQHGYTCQNVHPDNRLHGNNTTPESPANENAASLMTSYTWKGVFSLFIGVIVVIH